MITLSNFVGNVDLIRLLRISVAAAKDRNTALPHLLLKGPAGTGKTTLAEAIGQEFGTEPLCITPATAKKTEDLRKVFLRMPGEGYDPQGRVVGQIKPQILFCDECHQLPLLAQENLGIAMQDWRLPVRVAGKDTFEWVPRFTFIGATTLPGKLSKPFLDRFKIQADFETYMLDEAIAIANVHARSQSLALAPGVAEAIAQRSRGVARLIVRFLDRVADAAVVAAQGREDLKKTISLELAETMLRHFLKIDDRGLTRGDIKVLLQLAKFSDPIGVESLAAVTNEDKATIERVVEPYLIQEGLIVRTKRGRLITEEGRRYLAASGYLANERQAENARVIGEKK